MGFSAVVAVVAAVGAQQQHQAKKEAANEQRLARKEQVKAQSEEKAANAAQMAQDRRQTIREERIRRAKIIQASENTGVGESSGLMGATGSLQTQLGTNIGFSRGMEEIGGRISSFNQNAANFMTSAQNHLNDADDWGQISSISMSIFGASGGFDALKTSVTGTQAPAPVTTATPRNV